MDAGDAAADRVMERWIGEAPIAPTVEADAMQLQLEHVVAVARGVEEDARRLVDLDERADSNAVFVRQRSRRARR